jgi:hypothetical protein
VKAVVGLRSTGGGRPSVARNVQRPMVAGFRAAPASRARATLAPVVSRTWSASKARPSDETLRYVLATTRGDEHEHPLERWARGIPALRAYARTRVTVRRHENISGRTGLPARGRAGAGAALLGRRPGVSPAVHVTRALIIGGIAGAVRLQGHGDAAERQLSDEPGRRIGRAQRDRRPAAANTKAQIGPSTMTAFLSTTAGAATTAILPRGRPRGAEAVLKICLLRILESGAWGQRSSAPSASSTASNQRACSLPVRAGPIIRSAIASVGP